MSDINTDRYGMRAVLCAPDGPVLAGDQDVVDLFGATYLDGPADMYVIPAERLDPGFFTLRTGIAGQIAQKFAGYRKHLVIVGDIAKHLAASKSFRAFAEEANRGRQLWFVADLAELDDRMAAKK